MRVKLAKSLITAFDYSWRLRPADKWHCYTGKALACLPAHKFFLYLRVRAALSLGVQGGEPQNGGRSQACHELHQGTQSATGWASDASIAHGTVNALGSYRPVSLQCRTNPVD